MKNNVIIYLIYVGKPCVILYTKFLYILSTLTKNTNMIPRINAEQHILPNVIAMQNVSSGLLCCSK